MAGDVDRRAAIQLRISEIQREIGDIKREALPVWDDDVPDTTEADIARLEAEREKLLEELR